MEFSQEKEKELSAKEIIDLLEQGTDRQFTEKELHILIKSDEEENVTGKHIFENLKNFKNIGETRICEFLILGGYVYPLMNKLDLFSSETKLTLPDCLIKNYRGNYISEFLDRFPQADHQVIADKLIATGQGDQIFKYIDNFKNLNHSDLISSVLKTEILQRNVNSHIRSPLQSRRGLTSPGMPAAFTVLKNLKKLENINIDVLIDEIIVTGDSGMLALAQHIGDFDPQKHNIIAHKIIAVNGTNQLAIYLQDFRNLDQYVATSLIKTGNILRVAESKDQFLDLDQRTQDLISDIPFVKEYQPELTSILKKYPEITCEEIKKDLSRLVIESWEEGDALLEQDKITFIILGNMFDKQLIIDLFLKQDSRQAIHSIGPSILDLYTKSGLQARTFQNEFLQRIADDNSFYNEDNNQSALLYFNTVVEGIDFDVEKVITEAKNNSYTKDLAEHLMSQGLYKNWDWLKKYYELSNLIKKKEIFEKLGELKSQGKDNHVEFFSKLALHPTSKVSMEKVFQFMTDPEKFLDVGDSHTDQEVHNRKKPSNYTSFKHLDLNAFELRDSLVEGTLDDLQFFPPYSKEYIVPTEEINQEKLIILLAAALGSYRESIKGNAKNPGKLFQKIKEICITFDLNSQDLINKTPTLSTESKTAIEEILFDKNIGIKDTRKKNEYKLTIHPKSSPEGHLAGNDTACCMPFGSGKNNIYMYNTSCAVFTIQRKTGDSYRTIAQSVMTPDIDIGMPVMELRTAVEKEEIMSNVIQEDLTKKKLIMITADNIEIAPNAEKFKGDIEFLYTNFYKEYATIVESVHPDKKIATDVLLVGKGYADIQFKNAKEMRNLFIPIQPLAYSDNYGYKIDFLSLDNDQERSDVISKIGPLPHMKEKKVSVNDTIQPLSAEDTVRVSYMEGKVYAENESLVQYIHRIGNELTAKDINNTMKNRPNLSFKVEDSEGNLNGYLIAYEGVVDKSAKNPEKAIYISDLAVDTQKSKLAGGRLINKFSETILKEYLSKGVMIPIIAEARESTSYKIIQKQLSKISDKLGYEYKIIEEGTKERGNDVMHIIKLIPSVIVPVS